MARRSGAVPLDIGVEDQTIENREAPIYDRILMHESMRPSKWPISFVSDLCHIHPETPRTDYRKGPFKSCCSRMRLVFSGL
jgi:hypothetical protein